jgi:hypothetical protein
MRYYFLLLSLVLHGLLSGQDLNFIQADARWQVSVDIFDTEFTSPDYLYEYTFGQDTLLNDTLYTLVWYRFFAREEGFGGLNKFPQPFQTSLPFLYGAVREDLTEKQVYLRVFEEQNNEFETSQLLYDFNLQVGDEFIDAIVGDPILITQEGTQFLYGAERKVWLTSGGADIIEGIGSTQGPFEGLVTSLSGGDIGLHQYCQGTAMDCNVAVDGFVNNQRQWNVRTIITPITNGNTSIYTTEYRFLDTVLIAEQVYFELYERNSPYEGEFSPTGIFFREDDSSKVYRIDPTWDTTETLVYDFDLAANTSFPFESNYHPGLVYESIAADSLPLADGTNRQVLYFLSPPSSPLIEFISWYEDIGDLFNPFLPEWAGCPIIDGPDYLLLCYYDDYEGDITYLNDEGQDCYENLVSIAEVKQSSALLLYPNPSEGWISLSHDIPAAHLQLFDVYGRTFADYPVREQQVDLTALAPGTYVYRLLTNKQQQISQGKLLIK